MMLCNRLSPLAATVTRASRAQCAALFHGPAIGTVVREAPEFDPMGYSSVGAGPISRKAVGVRSSHSFQTVVSQMSIRPGATLYNQDSAFPAHTSGSRPYSHGNSASTAAAAATPTTLAPGVDLYGEDFVQGAWIP
eukprot:m.78678 g.78678  ORF g.78678 m.78678 type:complete len:136 (+) comp19226_c0_seq1:134-541(+)